MVDAKRVNYRENTESTFPSPSANAQEAIPPPNWGRLKMVTLKPKVQDTH